MEIGRVDDAVFSEVGGATAAGGSGSGGFSFALFSRISCSLSRERRTSRMSNHRLVPFVMLCLSIFRAVLLSIFFMTPLFSRSGSAGAHTTASTVASLAMLVVAAAALFLTLFMFVTTAALVSVSEIIAV